jgi:hypothetical protein
MFRRISDRVNGLRESTVFIKSAVKRFIEEMFRTAEPRKKDAKTNEGCEWSSSQGMSSSSLSERNRRGPLVSDCRTFRDSESS